MNNILRITIIAGLILLIFSGVSLLLVFLIGRSGSGAGREENNFYQVLREYDVSALRYADDYVLLNRELDRLEKMAQSVETWLSILKRRRVLSEVSNTQRDEYRKSLERALKIYPQSQYINALFSALIIKDTALNNRTEEALRECLSTLNDPVFNNLRLTFHILMGDFRSPSAAVYAIPQELFYDRSGIDVNIGINLALLKLMRNDIREATSDVQILLASSHSQNENLLRFAAEFYYDFGDLYLSAELFSRMEGDTALIRQADALYLAGYTENARLLWSMLSTGRSFYNLALTSENLNEKINYFDSLLQFEERRSLPVMAGLIHYSRFLDTNRAIEILESIGRQGRFYHPLLDLELCRRNGAYWERERRVSEAWLLLDRHPENPNLYNWAAWLMATHRSYGELSILLSRIDVYPEIDYFNEWMPFYRAAFFMQEGYLERAMSFFRSIPDDKVGWYVFANLGRIFEARRSFSQAIAQYETAVLKMPDSKTASRIEMQIARCLIALGRTNEAANAYRNALQHDPDNVTARFEFERLNNL